MSNALPPIPPPPRPAPTLHLTHPDHHIPGYELPETASTPPTKKACLIGFLIAAAIALLAAFLHHAGENAPIPDVPLLLVLPFVALLASIAIMPFAAKHFWEKNYQYISIALGLIVVACYLFSLHAPQVLAETFSDYISFIFLLASLFIVSGGVIIRIHRNATPAANAALLLFGALLANIFGTTGASMLLIRPYLRLNKNNVRPYHIVFFIFCVANVGGALTPIADPPLFLGYLRGVPFWWVLQHCWPIWLTAVGALVFIFFIIDTLHHRRKTTSFARVTKHPDAMHAAGDGGTAAGVGGQMHHLPRKTVSIFGIANLLFIALILAAVFLNNPYRELLMAAAAFASLATTSPRIYGENHFNYLPIKEIALLFLGIFATMIPAMNFLHTHPAALHPFLHSPGQFYFTSGALSSVLDNAPTYATFFSLLQPEQSQNLIALSMGSVFFGACTYIGNGPNFMVKSIADHANAPTPSFFTYILCYTLPILLPVLILCWLLFLC